MHARTGKTLGAAQPGIASRPSNNLLCRLSEDDFALIAGHLVPRERRAGELLYNPGDKVEYVYFPCDQALASFLVPSEDGRDVETVLVGREGAAGGIVSAGWLPAYCRITVKYAGPFVQLRAGVLQEAKATSSTLRNLFTRYADCLLAQVFQSTACNAIHTIEQRAAKWIIAAMERTGDHNVPLTHEQLATMLGVGRSYTSRVLQNLKADGILTTGRGSLRVQDFDRLAARACACNEAVKNHFETVLSGIYPDEVDRGRKAM
ncbi:Crp/Fnr family transcriptional regulator [Dongia sp. agr-C8]